jgi:putative ABC transport system permease protein
VPVSQLVHLAVGVAVLLAATYAVLRAGRVHLGPAPLVAVVRGAAQLAAVGLLLRGVITAPPAVALALLVMLGTATRTATGRLRGFERPGRAVVASCTAGAALALVVVVALGGIVIGNTMTGATLAGRHLRAGLLARREEVEAWLSLGATMRYAVSDVARHAAGEALVPALDQTRTTGLVTLPGAFIGALLGGASPVQAARFQLVVLAALICAEAMVAVLLTHFLGNPEKLPVA